MSVGLVIFDCDGVLVDSEPIATRILLETLAELGLEMATAEAYRAFLGKSLVSVCESLRRDYGIEADASALERMRERLYRALRRELQPIDGITEALEGLQRPFCVASSSQPERVRLSLEVTGLAAYFNGQVFSASMVERGKPAPDLFLHAAIKMGVARTDCLVVEDSPAGIEAALSAGMTAFGFTGGSHAALPAHREILESLGSALVFDDMRDLPNLVQAREGCSK